MTPKPDIEERPSVRYAGVRRRVTMDTFAVIADRIPVIIGWLAGQGLAPAGAPFLKYETFTAEGITVVAGVPVDDPLPDHDEIFTAVVPPGRYAVRSHHGHPDELVKATAELLHACQDHGLALDMSRDDQGEHWTARLEHLMTNPAETPDPADWTTILAIKLS